MMASWFRRPARMLSAWMVLPLLPLLAACGSSAGYPSLARRPVERIGGDGLARGCDCPPGRQTPQACETPRVTGSAPVVMPAPAIDRGTSAEASAGVAALVAQAREAHGRFEAGRLAAAAAVAAGAGAAPASEAWLRANQLLIELDRARGEAGDALAALDRIALDDRMAHALDDPDDTIDRPGAQAIRDGVAIVAGWTEAEDAVLAALKRKFVGE
jgi:hypothetical protein